MRFDNLVEVIIFLAVIGAFILEALGKNKKKQRPSRSPKSDPERGPVPPQPRTASGPRGKRITWDEVYRAPEKSPAPAPLERRQGVSTETTIEAEPPLAGPLGSPAPLEQKLEKLEQEEGLGHLLKADPVKIAVKYRSDILPSLSRKKQLKKTFLMMELLQPPKSLREEPY